MAKAPYTKANESGNYIARGCMISVLLVYGLVLGLIVLMALIICGPYLLWTNYQASRQRSKGQQALPEEN